MYGCCIVLEYAARSHFIAQLGCYLELAKQLPNKPAGDMTHKAMKPFWDLHPRVWKVLTTREVPLAGLMSESRSWSCEIAGIALEAQLSFMLACIKVLGEASPTNLSVDVMEDLKSAVAKWNTLHME